jgi:hypothetical protein
MKKFLPILLIFLFAQQLVFAKTISLNDVNRCAEAKRYYKAVKLINIMIKDNAGSPNNIQALIDKRDKLITKAERQKVLNRTIVRYDKYKDCYWIESSLFMAQPLNPVILKSNNQLSLKIKFHIVYTMSTWMFINKLYIYDDGERFQYKPIIGNRNVSCGGYSCTYYEDLWVDFSSKEALEQYDKMMRAFDLSIRVSGDSYYKDFKINNFTKDTMENFYKIYSWLQAGNIDISDFNYILKG